MSTFNQQKTGNLDWLSVFFVAKADSGAHSLKTLPLFLYQKSLRLNLVACRGDKIPNSFGTLSICISGPESRSE